VTDAELADALAVYQSARPRLFGVAYRMLGSVAEAEDVLQEVWMRWQPYVLREAFGYDYAEISSVVQVSEVAARQLVSRARKHLAEDRHREVGTGEQRRLLDAFVTAASTGDLRQLEQLLTEDVVSYSDGGGVVRASRIPVAGRETVAKFVRAFQPRFWEGVEVTVAEVNGRPAAVLRRDGEIVAVLALVTSQAGIRNLLWMMNPHKLGAVASRVA
jgi:RNA polymerase sigma-70 factor (ECF subfamily)